MRICTLIALLALACVGVPRRSSSTDKTSDAELLAMLDDSSLGGFRVQGDDLISPAERVIMGRRDPPIPLLAEAAGKRNSASAAAYLLLLIGGEPVRGVLAQLHFREAFPAQYAQYLASTGTDGDVDYLVDTLLNFHSDDRALEEHVLAEASQSLEVLKPERALRKIIVALKTRDERVDRGRLKRIKEVAYAIDRGDVHSSQDGAAGLREQLLLAVFRNESLFGPDWFSNSRIWIDRAGGLLWYRDRGQIRFASYGEQVLQDLAMTVSGEKRHWTESELESIHVNYCVSPDGQRALLRLDGMSPRLMEGHHFGVTLRKTSTGWAVVMVVR